MNWKKKILFIFLVIFIAMQIIQPAHNISGQVLATDIAKTISVPYKVAGIFKNACYDCHSNNTRYPWYVYIQPMGWMMAKHIRNGKENLNFSEFATYSKRKQANKLRSIGTSVIDGSMPLSSYTIMHTDAKLSREDKKLIADWASNIKDSLEKK